MVGVIIGILGIVVGIIGVLVGLKSKSSAEAESAKLNDELGSAKEKITKLNGIIKELSTKIQDLYPNRETLVSQWVEKARHAQKSIVAFTYSVGVHPEKDEEETKAWDEYVGVLHQKCQIGGFTARILGPKMREKISELYRRQKAGAQAKVSPRIDMFDFRFQICDMNTLSETMVLNLPSPEKKGMASEVGILIPQQLIVDKCIEIFEKEWSDKQSINLDEYIADLIEEFLPDDLKFPGRTVNNVSDFLGLDIDACSSYIANLIKDGKVVKKGDHYYQKR